MLKLLLEDNSTEYELPCCEGKLSEFATIQSGTYTHGGFTWNVDKGLNSGNQYISINKQGTAYISEAQIDEALEFLGLNIDHKWIDLYDTLGYCDLYLRAEDQENTFPRYRVKITNDGSVGQMQNHKTYDFNLENTTHSIQQWDSYTTSMGYVAAVYCSPILLAGSEDNYIFGAYRMKYDHVTGYCTVSINIEWNTAVNTNTWTEPAFEPGDKGFRPTGARTDPKKPGIGGGRGNKVPPGYFSDPINQPGAPDETHASACRLGFIRAYKMTEGNLQTFGECLFGSTFEGFLRGLTENPLDFVVSLNIFPCSPHVGSNTAIQLSRYTCLSAQSSKNLGADSYGAPLTSQFRTFDFGTISIAENWGSFLDYSQTEIELYLPFIGTVSIDTAECMGGTINVQYTIDFFTGQCVANVLCSKPGLALPNGQALSNVHAQHAYQGNVASQIPLTRVDYGSMIGNLINACTQAITNPVAGIMSGVSDTLNGGFRPNVSSKGNLVANSGYCSVLFPYLRITRPITAEPDSYQEVVGYPSYINTKLGQCEGLCVCKDIDLSGINGATESELNRIKQACREGVYV